MSQEVRNKIYAIVSALLVILTTAGVITAEDSNSINTFADQALNIVSSAVALVGTILAWFKSRPSKTVTLDIPKNDVLSVNRKSELPR